MDIDPAKIAFARNNARVYGVDDRIRFMVGDFFNNALSLPRADAIVTSPPVEIKETKIRQLLSLTSRVASKVLFRLPKTLNKSKVGNLQTVMNVLRSSIFFLIAVPIGKSAFPPGENGGCYYQQRIHLY